MYFVIYRKTQNPMHFCISIVKPNAFLFFQQMAMCERAFNAKSNKCLCFYRKSQCISYTSRKTQCVFVCLLQILIDFSISILNPNSFLILQKNQMQLKYESQVHMRFTFLSQKPMYHEYFTRKIWEGVRGFSQNSMRFQTSITKPNAS